MKWVILKYIPISGMALFHHNSERLEVTEGGYTSRLDGYDIIYWKGSAAQVNIFIQVFDLSLWLGILVCTTILTLYFFVESMIYQKQDGKGVQIIEAVVANSKMIVAMDVNERKHHTKYSMRPIQVYWSASFLWNLKQSPFHHFKTYKLNQIFGS